MKKHTGWNKIMTGVVKSPSNIQNTTLNKTKSNLLSPSMLNQIGSKTTKNTAIQRRFSTYYVNKAQRDPMVVRNDMQKEEQDVGYLKSKSVSIHPFYHSLVT